MKPTHATELIRLPLCRAFVSTLGQLSPPSTVSHLYHFFFPSPPARGRQSIQSP